MPEIDSTPFENTQAKVDAVKADTAWANGKEIETREHQSKLGEHFDLKQLDLQTLHEALENHSQDAWDQETGNIIKIVDYQKVGEADQKAQRVIFKIREHTYKTEKERIDDLVAKQKQREEKSAEAKRQETTQEIVDCPLNSKIVIGSAPEKLGNARAGVQAFLEGSKPFTIEPSDSSRLPEGLLGMQFTERGLYLVSLTDQAQMEVHYRSGQDGKIHDVPVSAESGGTADEGEMFLFNRDAVPGQTWIDIHTNTGGHFRLSDQDGVIAGRSFQDWIAGRPSSIKSIHWKLEEVVQTKTGATEQPLAQVAESEPGVPPVETEKTVEEIMSEMEKIPVFVGEEVAQTKAAEPEKPERENKALEQVHKIGEIINVDLTKNPDAIIISNKKPPKVDYQPVEVVFDGKKLPDFRITLFFNKENGDLDPLVFADEKTKVKMHFKNLNGDDSEIEFNNFKPGLEDWERNKLNADLDTRSVSFDILNGRDPMRLRVVSMEYEDGEVPTGLRLQLAPQPTA